MIALMGSKPQRAMADAGYFTEVSVTDERWEGIDLFVSPDKQKHGDEVPVATGRPATESRSVAERMRYKLRRPERRAVYKRRKAIVEPVLGQIKEARGFRRFLLRGLGKAETEWKLICATHNLLKLNRSG